LVLVESTQYRLARAGAEDRVWLEELRRSVYRDLFFATWGAWDEERHLRHFAECWEQGSIELVEVDGARVGMVQIFERPDEVVVAEIQIAPQSQSKGIGSCVLRDVIARAHARGKKVTLSTGLQNRRAFDLYVRVGFKHTGRTETHDLFECPPE